MKVYVKKEEMARKKLTKKLDNGFGITKEDKKRAMGCNYVIDTNKRKALYDEPELTE